MIKILIRSAGSPFTTVYETNLRTNSSPETIHQVAVQCIEEEAAITGEPFEKFTYRASKKAR